MLGYEVSRPRARQRILRESGPGLRQPVRRPSLETISLDHLGEHN